MAETVYTYDIIDFPENSVDTAALHGEIIAEPTLVPTFIGIDINGDDVDILFDPALSAGQQTTLSGVVVAHGGSLTYDTEIHIPISHTHLFTALDDTPTTYSGEAGKYLRVGTTESGVEFVDHDDDHYTKEEINNFISTVTSGSGRYITFGNYSDNGLVEGALKATGGATIGYVMPISGTITEISVLTDIVNSNNYSVLVNDSVVDTLTLSGSVLEYTSSLNIPYNSGDKITTQLNLSTTTTDINSAYTPDANTLFLAHFDGDDEDLRHVTNSSTIAKGMTGRLINSSLNQTGIFDKCISLDGSSDYVEILHHDDYNTIDSTIEFFFNPSSLSGWSCMFSKMDNSGGIYIGFNGNKLYTWIGSDEYTSSASFSTVTWYHIAVVMGTGGLKVFIDGTSVHTDVTTDGLNGNVELIALGASLETNNKDYYKNIEYYYTGKLDELRISKIRRYETDFTKPSVAFTKDSNTLGLWHFNETSGVLVYDSSDTIHNAMMMANGSMCQIKTDFVKFGTHSIKMNGSRNDWLRFNHTTYYESDTITIESWIRVHKDSRDGYVFQKGDSNTEGGLIIKWKEGSLSLVDYIEVTYYGASTSRILSTNDKTFPKNVWHHIAVQLHSDYIKVFVDGVQQVADGLTADFQNVWNNNKEDLYIAANKNKADYGQIYCDEVRISDTIRSLEGSNIKEVTMIVGVR